MSEAPQPEKQSATVSFHEPGEVLPHLLELDGLGYVEAVRDGGLPPDPLMEAMGISVTEVEQGRVVMEAVPQRHHLNLGGIVHGGFLATILDATTGFALHSTLPAQSTAPHVAVSYQFLRAALPGVRLRAEAKVLRKGTRLGHVQAELHDENGRQLATAETTHAIIVVEGMDHMQAGPSA
ncbi:MAG: PaaI family thioesterase [Solirubrobacteraceae bacterium]|nr:PaaI family thioesterase [Solirubrobacteraceae bacterium]